jgi:WD40 repeat protein
MTTNLLKSALFFLAILIVLPSCSQEDKPSLKLEQAIDGAYAADISDDGRLSLMSSIHHGISLWQTQPGKLLYQWHHNGQDDNDVFIVRIAPGSRFAITASRNDFVVWNTETGQAKGFWTIGQSSIRDVALSSNGQLVLAGLGDGKVLHINLETGRRLEFLGHSEKINSVAMSANGRYALTGGNDYQALLWDTQTAQVIQRFKHSGRVTSVALDSEGRYAFSADTGQEARVYAIPSGKLISQLKAHSRQDILTHVRFVNDAKWILTGSPSRQLRLWHTASGQLLQRWRVTPRKDSRPESAVVYSSAIMDNGSIISAASSGLLEFWTINKDTQ